MRDALLAEFADRAPAITELFRVSNDHFVTRHTHALPGGHRWKHRRGLALLGDAVHLMSPFGGEGVSEAALAMRLIEQMAGSGPPRTMGSSFSSARCRPLPTWLKLLPPSCRTAA